MAQGESLGQAIADEICSVLDAYVREGARQMLQRALECEVNAFLSFGAPKPATHRRPKPATVWGVLNRRIVLFGPVGKGRGQVVAV